MLDKKTKQKIIEKLNSINYSEVFVYDVMEKKEYTYKEIFSNAYYISKNLLGKNNIVIMENSIKLLIMYFAAIFAKCTLIPIDPEKSKREIDLIKSYHSDSKIFKDKADTDIFEYEELTEEEISELFYTVDFDRDYLITYTSGSTGSPKGVIHSLGNLLNSAISFGEKMGYDSSKRICHMMPMTYMAGILNTIILPFITGGKIVLFERFSVKRAIRFWQNIIAYKVNTMWLSPIMLHLIMAIDKGKDVVTYFENVNMTISVGTAALPIELKKNFEKKYNVKVYQSYGLSETLFVSTADNNLKNVQSVGTLLEGVDIQINKDSEILIDLPWMFKGYVNAETENYFEDGKYKTGDLGKIVEKELFICGRKKDLIIRGGMNINPKDIEECIGKMDNINDVCVASVMVNGEERVVCWYSGNVDDENLLNNIAVNQLGKNYKIDYFRQLKQIPRNLNGKVDKLKLIERFGEKNENN